MEQRKINPLSRDEFEKILDKDDPREEEIASAVSYVIDRIEPHTKKNIFMVTNIENDEKNFIASGMRYINVKGNETPNHIFSILKPLVDKGFIKTTELLSIAVNLANNKQEEK